MFSIYQTDYTMPRTNRYNLPKLECLKVVALPGREDRKEKKERGCEDDGEDVEEMLQAHLNSGDKIEGGRDDDSNSGDSEEEKEDPIPPEWIAILEGQHPDLAALKKLWDLACKPNACEPHWTSVAPSSRLVNPRVLATKLTPEQDEVLNKKKEETCRLEKPNRFLKFLSATYPHLYLKMRQLPRVSLDRRIDRTPLISTYQVGYCGAVQRAAGCYAPLTTEVAQDKITARRFMFYHDVCEDLKDIWLEEINSYKDKRPLPATEDCQEFIDPVVVHFGAGATHINNGNNSHWRAQSIFKKRQDLPEFVQNLGRSGQILIPNKTRESDSCNKNKSCQPIRGCGKPW